MSQIAVIPSAIDAEIVRTNATANKLGAPDRAIRDWYHFALSFPPHLVRDYLQRFTLIRSE